MLGLGLQPGLGALH